MLAIEAPGELAGQERREERRAGEGEHRRQRGQACARRAPGSRSRQSHSAGESGERRLRQRDREPEADDEGREEDAPEGVHAQ